MIRRTPSRAASSVVLFLGMLIALVWNTSNLESAVEAIPGSNASSATRRVQIAGEVALQRASQEENWRGQQETRVKLLWPSLSAEEIASLEDYEINTEAFKAIPVDVDFEREPSKFMQQPDIVAPNRYIYLLNGEYIDVPAGDLPAPELSLSNLDGFYPVVSMAGENNLGRRFILRYYEIDTVPSFDSPNLWRAPNLVPDFGKIDATGRGGEVLHVHYSSQREAEPAASGYRFPFRSTAMALPLSYGRVNFDDLERQAQLLAYGLSGEDIIREIYAHIRQTYTWGRDRVTRQPIDTFLARTGACGHVNDLFGAMLELNGFRYRVAGGFSPRWRVLFPGGGHAGIEILDLATQRWSYADPYLDVLAHHVSAEELTEHSIGDLPAFTPDDETLSPSFAQLRLRELFRFRTYGDFSMRLPMARMTQLFGREREYGLDWRLRKGFLKLNLHEDLPEKLTIHVRGRYLASDCPIRFGGDKLPTCDPSMTSASPWAMASFEVKPRELLSSGTLGHGLR